MTQTIYDKITRSFLIKEEEDFKGVCALIDGCGFSKHKVAVIMDDPYLLVLVFTSLIRYSGIQIHLINPKESEIEIRNQLQLIDPDAVLATDKTGEFIVSKKISQRKRLIIINGHNISNESHEADRVIHPQEVDFKLVTYTPYPVKVKHMSNEMFSTLLYATIQDLYNFGLVDYNVAGMIPFATDNSDYLLHFIAVKIAQSKILSTTLLPSSEDDVEFIVSNNFKRFNNAKTLFIPKKEFMALWESKISSLFESRFIFKSYVKRKWLVNILIRRRIKKVLGHFKNVLIIGTIDDTYIANILKNISFIKFYTLFPVREAMMFGPISNSIDSVVLATTEYRQDLPHKVIEPRSFGSTIAYALSFRLYNQENDDVYTLTDVDDRFTINHFGDNGKQLFFLGRYKNAFVKDNALIFPETLEKVINSYPFIKECALLTFADRMTLVVNPNMDVLDANRINYNMFRDIINKQIFSLNKQLPESYKIQGLVISTSLIEQDRNGEIVRFPFNFCNKQ